jgi:hypothetical protein
VSELAKLIADENYLEPEGWVRSVPDMRRRPGGDKTKEYKAPWD